MCSSTLTAGPEPSACCSYPCNARLRINAQLRFGGQGTQIVTMGRTSYAGATPCKANTPRLRRLEPGQKALLDARDGDATSRAAPCPVMPPPAAFIGGGRLRPEREKGRTLRRSSRTAETPVGVRPGGALSRSSSATRWTRSRATRRDRRRRDRGRPSTSTAGRRDGGAGRSQVPHRTRTLRRPRRHHSLGHPMPWPRLWRSPLLLFRRSERRPPFSRLGKFRERSSRGFHRAPPEE